METRQNDFAVTGTPTLVVENINGDVDVSGSAEIGRVLVTARLRRPERLEYRATQEGNTVRVTVEKGEAGGNWWSRLWRRSGASDISVAVPPTVNLDVHSSNGDITALRVAGTITLRTSNGDIDARLTAESPSVRLSASTSNGSIQLERRVAVSELTGKNRLEGMIGDGAAALTLATSNGTVTIK